MQLKEEIDAEMTLVDGRNVLGILNAEGGSDGGGGGAGVEGSSAGREKMVKEAIQRKRVHL